MDDRCTQCGSPTGQWLEGCPLCPDCHQERYGAGGGVVFEDDRDPAHAAPPW